MDSTVIYSDEIFNNLVATIAETVTDTNKKVLENCIRISQVDKLLLEKHQGKINTKGYKDDKKCVYECIRTSKPQYIRDAQIGEYLTNNADNQDLWGMTKNKIYTEYIREPKPKTTKPKVKPESNEDLEYYKAGYLKYVALMDFMGDKADSILAKALQKAKT